MKTVLVTGAAGGIGFDIVRAFSESGYFAVGVDILDAAGKYAGLNNAEYVRGDITDSDARRAAIDAAVKKSGGLDVLVNAAGVAPKVRADLLETGEESYDRVMDINAKALFFMTQEAARRMIAREVTGRRVKGYIVNISSMSAYTSSASRGEYCISKAGVSMITALFADRLAEYGILVNEIRPGIIATPMTEGVKEKYDKLIEGGLLPVKRWGEPADISRAVSALVSGAFDYTTGQSVDVDGGFHIRRL
jgi:NAD(P)-dependent dehydrogenase (short-subunit alcohol dehydrogenase family)